MMRLTMRISLLCALVIATGVMTAYAADPKLAPGRDPGGSAVAVIASGFDYTRPALAAVLARDGEGEAIAWDTLDNDRLPYATNENGTDLALAAARNGNVRIVAIRTDVRDAPALAKAIAFAIATQARIALVPLDAEQRSGLAVIVAAARRFEAVLFVSSIANPTPDERKAAEAIPNLMLLDSSGRANASGEAIATALGCAHGNLAGTSGAEMKGDLSERLERPAADCEQDTSKP